VLQQQRAQRQVCERVAAVHQRGGAAQQARRDRAQRVCSAAVLWHGHKVTRGAACSLLLREEGLDRAVHRVAHRDL
jgi:hypothetical protein